MSKPEWGVKRLCPSCSALYYDMKKNPPVCPKCSTEFDPEQLLKSRRRVVADEKVKKPVVAETEELVEDIEVEEVDGDDEVIDDVEDGDDDIEVEVDDEK